MKTQFEVKDLNKLLKARFEEITNGENHLFEVDVDKEELWNLYLDSFPAGTNEMYRERREYDCNACKNFVRRVGNVVSIKNNKVSTIWDIVTEEDKFQVVVDELNKHVKSKKIKSVFTTKEKTAGVKVNHEMLASGEVKNWEHMHIELPSKFVNKTASSNEEINGGYKSSKDVFKRSLDEITEESLLTIIELIKQKSLYKGEEWLAVLTEFLKHKKAYSKITKEEEKNNYAWYNSVKNGGALTRIRNHSIGTLLVDVSNNEDLDVSVRKYEKIVAPSNYKRPKAIFTKKMLEDAKKTVEELGLLTALNRRYATLDDITVNNVLFSNKDAASRVEGAKDVFAQLASSVPENPKKFSKVEEVGIEDFIKNILPSATSLEAFVENKHVKNFVSLIAPENKDAKNMLKWDNNYSWAYAGNITDSEITERVREAGGSVDGVLRFSHSWNHSGLRNSSLMDLHVFMPKSNQSVNIKGDKEIHDNYGNKNRVGWNNRKHYISGGSQDVDFVNAAKEGYIPVENITFPYMNRLEEGVYTFKIHNWKYRNPTTGGFKAEIAFGGQVFEFEHSKPLGDKEWVTVAKIELKNGEFKVLEMMENSVSSKEVWGVQTNQFVPVSVALMSPNYWDEQQGIGNKHYIFMLKDCVNSESPNGFYNEFLKEELLVHKRVFEALGAQMAVKDVEDQLSGIGFSSTKRNELLLKVKGQTERVIKVKF